MMKMSFVLFATLLTGAGASIGLSGRAPSRLSVTDGVAQSSATTYTGRILWKDGGTAIDGAVVRLLTSDRKEVARGATEPNGQFSVMAGAAAAVKILEVTVLSLTNDGFESQMQEFPYSADRTLEMARLNHEKKSLFG